MSLQEFWSNVMRSMFEGVLRSAETIGFSGGAIFIFLAVILAGSGSAQDLNNPAAIGIPGFSTVTNGPEQINLGNLNVHWEFPIVAKGGRIPATFALVYDSSFHYSVLPMTAFGWSFRTAVPLGAIESGSTSIPETCTVQGQGQFQTTKKTFYYAYVDSTNMRHSFGTIGQTIDGCTLAVTGASGSIPATDGSGYTLNLDPQAVLSPTVSMPSGAVFDGPPGVGARITDSNGNQLTNPGGVIPAAGDGGTVTFTDTLGMTVLTATTGAARSTVNPPQTPPYVPDTYTYTDPNGSSQTVTVNYSPFTIQTAFGCSTGEFSGPNPWPLVTSIVYPDGGAYSFTYEPTPGVPGKVTGRLQSVTVPTGGTITYTYTGANDGYHCFDGTTMGLTRQDPDGTTSYVRTNPSGTEWKTVATYPPDSVTGQQNQTDFYFQLVVSKAAMLVHDLGAFFYYETKHVVFQGADSGTPIETVHTCYNGATPDCTSTAVSLPITQITQVKQLANGLQDQTVTFKNSAGLTTEVDEYDYGSNAVGSLIRKTVTAYASLGNNILDRPSSVTIYDGNQNQLAKTQYGYDETAAQPTSNVPQHVAISGSRGNRTSVSRWLNTTGSLLPSTMTYDDTGNPLSSTDPLGNQTQYSYGDNFIDGVNRNSLAFVTQVTLPVTSAPTIAHHVVSSKYEPNSGLKSASIDENGSETDYAYDLLFRTKSVTLPADTSGLRPQMTLQYPDRNTIIRQKAVTSGLVDSITGKLDGLGRTAHTLHATPSGTATTDASYDSFGRLFKVSNPYFSTSDPTYGVTQTQYDGLGRAIRTSKPDGSVVSTAYEQSASVSTSGDCTQVTDEAGFQRMSCSDALGRLVQVVEPGTVPPQNDYAILQTDGNFVVYNSSHTGLWSTGTFGTTPGQLDMQSDGNLVLYAAKWQAGTSATPAGSFAQPSCSVGHELDRGQTLAAGSCISSPQGQYELIMQTDGNLVLYNLASGSLVAIWSTGTFGNPGAWATMQTDGNFVVYSSTNVALWSSGTAGTPSLMVKMEDNGLAVVLFAPWATATAPPPIPGNMTHPSCDMGPLLTVNQTLQMGQCLVSPNGRYELLMQTDGNLVLYDTSANPPVTMWSSGTMVSPMAATVAMTTLYGYDTLGNLTRVDQKGTAPNDSTQWRTRQFTYDSLSRLLTAYNPETTTLSYSYDANGNLLQKTMPQANQTTYSTETISYCYDALNRMVAKGYSSSPNPPQQCSPAPPYLPNPATTWNYDQGGATAKAIGRLTSLSDLAGSGNYSHDALGRVGGETRVINGVSKSMSYTYNLDGSIASITYPSPSNAVVTYTPWNNGTIAVAGAAQSATDTGNGINYASAANYQADGQMTAFTSGNSGSFAGITNNFSFNQRLQPVTMSAVSPSATVFSLTYDFGAGRADNGNVWGITNNKDTSRSQTFTYDPLNRLLSAQNVGTDCTQITTNGKTKYWGNNYGYDAWGNLLSKSVTKCSGEGLSVTVAPNNQLAGYVYDIAGNIMQDATSGQRLSYAYDPENRITGVNGFTYVYDADGNRVEKTNGNTGTIYWYMSPGIVAETDLGGNLQSEYVFFGGERIARKDFPSSAVSYYFSDHLKTTDLVTDAQGNIKKESDFYPWGGELQFVANDSNHYEFTGKERDSETGLDYFGARYYSNGLGRFITPDWAEKATAVPYAEFADSQSLNLYTYVRNIPTTRLDGDGHQGDPFCTFGCSGDPTLSNIQSPGARLGTLLRNQPDYYTGLDNYGAEGFGSRPSTPAAPHFTYKINQWIYDGDQKLDKVLHRWYVAFDNVLWLLQPCHDPNIGCGVVFPVGGAGAEAAGAEAAASAVADSVIAETVAAFGKGNITSAATLTADEALVAAEKFLGSGYKELGKPGSGVFRSADGLRQFRIDPNSLGGRHSPFLPHVHFEIYDTPGAKFPVVNNHVPFAD